MIATFVAMMVLAQADGGQATGIGCAPPSGEWTCATVKAAPGYRAPCIAVGRNGYWLATLPASATADDVRRVLASTSGAPMPGNDLRRNDDRKQAAPSTNPPGMPRKYRPAEQETFQRRFTRTSSLRVVRSANC